MIDLVAVCGNGKLEGAGDNDFKCRNKAVALKLRPLAWYVEMTASHDEIRALSSTHL